MNMARLASSFAFCGILFAVTATTYGQNTIEKEIVIHPRKVADDLLGTRLLPTLATQEPGNAAPVLLRMTYEMDNWMLNERPKLFGDLPQRDHTDAELQAFPFERFAGEIIRAGGMSHANWEYPLQSSRPYDVLLPDAQGLYSILGNGMTIWIKQQIAKDDLAAAAQGTQAQLSCARHLSATPIAVCQLFGNRVAMQSLDNLELLMQQSPEVENFYWALSVLPASLGDLAATTQWESVAFRKMLPSLKEPMPEIGSDRWPVIADEFIEMMENFGEERYNAAEILTLTAKLNLVASRFLQEELDWTEMDLNNASIEERVMRWVLVQRRWFDLQAEQMAVASIPEALEIHRRIREKVDAIMQETGSKHNPFPQAPFSDLLQFTRRVRFLQTIETIRDHAARHQGQLPDSLDTLKFPAPLDPFTNAPFEYRKNAPDAWLSYPPVPGDPNPTRSYHLTRQQ